MYAATHFVTLTLMEPTAILFYVYIYRLHIFITIAILLRDGRSRAGVYCAANACIEQVIKHGEVDVFQAVKTVRRHRPQLVENMVSKLHTF